MLESPQRNHRPGPRTPALLAGAAVALGLAATACSAATVHSPIVGVGALLFLGLAWVCGKLASLVVRSGPVPDLRAAGGLGLLLGALTTYAYWASFLVLLPHGQQLELTAALHPVEQVRWAVEHAATGWSPVEGQIRGGWVLATAWTLQVVVLLVVPHFSAWVAAQETAWCPACSSWVDQHRPIWMGGPDPDGLLHDMVEKWDVDQLAGWPTLGDALDDRFTLRLDRCGCGQTRTVMLRQHGQHISSKGQRRSLDVDVAGPFLAPPVEEIAKLQYMRAALAESLEQGGGGMG